MIIPITAWTTHQQRRNLRMHVIGRSEARLAYHRRRQAIDDMMRMLVEKYPWT